MSPTEARHFTINSFSEMGSSFRGASEDSNWTRGVIIEDLVFT